MLRQVLCRQSVQRPRQRRSLQSRWKQGQLLRLTNQSPQPRCPPPMARMPSLQLRLRMPTAAPSMTVRPLTHHAEAALNLHAHAQAADTNAVGGAAAPALTEAVALLPAPSTASGADAALATVRREMAAAKEAAAAEMALMRRQLASAQAAASEAEKAGARPVQRPQAGAGTRMRADPCNVMLWQTVMSTDRQK